MKFAKALILSTLVSGAAISNPLQAGNQITAGLQAVDVIHKGEAVSITRSDDKEATMPKAFAKVGTLPSILCPGHSHCTRCGNSRRTRGVGVSQTHRKR